MGSEKPATGVVSRGGGLSSAKSRRESFWFGFVFKISLYFFAVCFFSGLFVLGLFVFFFAVTHVCVANLMESVVFQGNVSQVQT